MSNPDQKDFKNAFESIKALLTTVEFFQHEKPTISPEFQRVIDWIEYCSKPYVPPEEQQFDSKDIYMRKGEEIIGLHAIGYAGPYEYDLVNLDKTVTRMKSDFMAIEKWGNEYDKDFNMLGRGSFRVHDDIEIVAKSLEEDGWVRFER
jgi:hypothetical protein